MIGRILAPLGVQLIEAVDGAAALALASARDQPVELLITDVIMPNLDGPDLARALRAEHPGLPVLFVSGYAPTAGLAALLAEPCTRFLGKPFDPEAFLAAVAALLPSPR
jgi:CheY-like chemotaxis protein